MCLSVCLSFHLVTLTGNNPFVFRKIPNRLRYTCVVSWLILNQAYASHVWHVYERYQRQKYDLSLKKCRSQPPWYVNIRFWVVGQRMKAFYRFLRCFSFPFFSFHYFVLVESFYTILPRILSMKMNTSYRHTTQILSRILNIIRILSRFIIISHSRQSIHNIYVDVKIALSIAATYRWKMKHLLFRSHLTHHCVLLGSGWKWKVIAKRSYSIHAY